MGETSPGESGTNKRRRPCQIARRAVYDPLGESGVDSKEAELEGFPVKKSLGVFGISRPPGC